MASAAAPAPPVPDAPPEAVCIICLDRGDEPLHRNCVCRGPTAGFAHMSCLVRYVSSAAETNPNLWYDCGTCKQRYFGATMMGLARARWERARDRPEEDDERILAMDDLADALSERALHENRANRRGPFGDSRGSPAEKAPGTS